MMYALKAQTLDMPLKYRGIMFCGPMSSGKTTYASIFAAGATGGRVLSLASELKRICIGGYGMSPEPSSKDRSLLQSVGDAMRSIHPDVFVNLFLAEVNTSPHRFVACDDGRRLNEFRRAKEGGFLLVFLDVDEGVRLERTKILYPQVVAEHMAHPTETECRTEEAMRLYDLIVPNNTDRDLAGNVPLILEALCGRVPTE